LAFWWLNVIREIDAPSHHLPASRHGHEQPCPCIMADRPRRRLLRAIRHHAASPKVSRSMFRVPAKPGILTSSGTRVATPGGHAPRQAVSRFAGLVLVMESCSPTPCAASAPSSLRPRWNKCSVGRQGPEQEESLARRRRLGSMRSLPRGLEIDQESGGRENSQRLGKKKNPQPPSR
jgi:hypothetical protein